MERDEQGEGYVANMGGQCRGGLLRIRLISRNREQAYNLFLLGALPLNVSFYHLPYNAFIMRFLE